MSLRGKRTGERGEELAASYIAEKGYRILDRNYRCRFGEIDIVAQDGETIVFVEVKSRRSDSYGVPQLAVDRGKRKKMSIIALTYLSARHLQNRPARFDVVAVKMLPAGPMIELIRDAFELSAL